MTTVWDFWVFILGAAAFFAFIGLLLSAPEWLPHFMSYLTETARERREERQRAELHRAQLAALKTQVEPPVQQIVHHLVIIQPGLAQDQFGGIWIEQPQGGWLSMPQSTAITRRGR